jgi:acetate kinase
MKILVLNEGSSSLKSALYDLADPFPEHPPAPLWEGKIEWGNMSQFRVKSKNGEVSSGSRAPGHIAKQRSICSISFGRAARRWLVGQRKLKW